MIIKPNEGTIDRAIRIILAMAIFAGGYFYLSGTLQIVSIIFSAILLITSIIGYCGLYSIFGINTCKVSKKK